MFLQELQLKIHIMQFQMLYKALIKKNVFVVILGGSQDITFANYKAYEKLRANC